MAGLPSDSWLTACLNTQRTHAVAQGSQQQLVECPVQHFVHWPDCCTLFPLAAKTSLQKHLCNVCCVDYQQNSCRLHKLTLSVTIHLPQYCLLWPHRILSPPLSSPRPLAPQPPPSPGLHPPVDALGPSQLQAQPPTQSPPHIPVSLSHGIRVTVDRGCGPIIFSDDSGSDVADEEASGKGAEKKGMGRKRQIARYSMHRLDRKLQS